MVYALKLLFTVLLALLVGARALRSAFDGLLTPTQYKRAWGWLFVATVVSFLSLRPPIFCLTLAIVAWSCGGSLAEGALGRLTAFFLLLFALPPISLTIGGFGGINYILNLDYERVLSLVLLAPLAVTLLLRRRTSKQRPFLIFDLLVFGYQFWSIALVAHYSNLTGIVRTAATAAIDVMIPYYAVTRGIRSVAEIRFVASHLAVGAVLAAIVAAAETLTQHNLYAGLQWVYGQQWQTTFELMRGGLLRVESTTPQPIVLAFMMVFSLGLWTWLRGEEWRRRPVAAVYLLMLFALASTWSRGPWLGGVALVAALAGMRILSARAFGFCVLVLLAAAGAIQATGGGAAVAGVLASLFGETAGASTIDYRRQLLDAALALIRQSPWFGVPDYETGLAELRQGEGIIDIVNTYVVVMINSGVIGLAIFLLPYALLLKRLLDASVPPKGEPRRSMGRFAPAMIAMTLALLFVILTTSPIGVIRSVLMLLVAVPALWLSFPAAEREAPAAELDEGATSRRVRPGLARRPLQA